MVVNTENVRDVTLFEVRVTPDYHLYTDCDPVVYIWDYARTAFTKVVPP